MNMYTNKTKKRKKKKKVGSLMTSIGPQGKMWVKISSPVLCKRFFLEFFLLVNGGPEW